MFDGLGGQSVGEAELGIVEKGFGNFLEGALAGSTFKRDAIHKSPPWLQVSKEGVIIIDPRRINQDHFTKTPCFYQRRHPDSGIWEKFAEIEREMPDPDLFFDDDGRVFIYFGLGGPTAVIELDPETFEEMPDSHKILRKTPGKLADFFHGLERGRRELFAETDTAEYIPHFKMPPSRDEIRNGSDSIWDAK